MAIIETNPFGLRDMPFSSIGNSVPHSVSRIWRRLGAIATVVALLPACNTSGKLVLASGSTAKVASFVAADDPAAAEVGRAILAEGGTAADAAAATGLALTVTQPARAGLGGGGVCVVFDAAAKTNRTLDFMPRGSGNAATPMTLRGLYGLQAENGKLQWARIVAPAERLAERTPVSRGLAADLATDGSRLDPAARAVFANAKEGATVAQPQLQAFLGDIRRSGLRPIHGPDGSAQLARALGLDAAGIQRAVPAWRDALVVDLGSPDLALADIPEVGGGKLIKAAVDAADKAGSAGQAQAALGVVDAAAKGGDAAPGVGFVVVDATESAVACTLTMGASFGNGHLVSGAGFLAGVPVRDAGFGTPALATLTGYGRTLFAVAASAGGHDGALAAPRGLLDASLPILIDEKPAEEVLKARAPTAPGRLAVVACKTDSYGSSQDCEPIADSRLPGGAYTVTKAQ